MAPRCVNLSAFRSSLPDVELSGLDWLGRIAGPIAIFAITLSEILQILAERLPYEGRPIDALPAGRAISGFEQLLAQNDSNGPHHV